MSFLNKIVVVAGATGVMGSGAVRRFLNAGATVIGISRSANRIDRLKEMLTIDPAEPFDWMRTTKNAALLGRTFGLAGETANDAARVHGTCVHMPVAPLGSNKNQLGMDAQRDGMDIGVGIANRHITPGAPPNV